MRKGARQGRPNIIAVLGGQQCRNDMINMMKFYVLNIPKSLYAIGALFFILLLLICYGAFKNSRKESAK